LEGRGFLEPEAEKLKAELTLRAQAQEAGGVDRARAVVAGNPNDRNLQLKLAEALAAAGQHEEALELCLRLVEEDRKGVGEQARRTMLDIFQLLPEDSQLVSEYRKKLSLALY
jgi:putative thioredoxin